MSSAIRVGIIGTGQAFRRLYEPALRLTPGIRVSATADPASNARFGSAEEMFAGTELDGVIVLSPPALHAQHVGLAAGKGLRVLVEKPPGLTAAEVGGWPNPELVTPAFSRRYWPQYRERRSAGQRWVYHLQTNPAGWGATHAESPERDLLPHAADLAGWLSGERIASIEEVKRYRSGVGGVFQLDTGGRFEWTVVHGGSYAETLTVGGVAVMAPAMGLRERGLQRLGRRPATDVAGVAALLSDWARAVIGGETPPTLPTVADARACAMALEAVERATAGNGA